MVVVKPHGTVSPPWPPGMVVMGTVPSWPSHHVVVTRNTSLTKGIQATRATHMAPNPTSCTAATPGRVVVVVVVRGGAGGAPDTPGVHWRGTARTAAAAADGRHARAAPTNKLLAAAAVGARAHRGDAAAPKVPARVVAAKAAGAPAAAAAAGATKAGTRLKSAQGCA